MLFLRFNYSRTHLRIFDENAYIDYLPNTYKISNIFNVGDLSSYFGKDEDLKSRMSYSQLWKNNT